MVTTHYLRWLALGLAGWFGLFLAFTWLVDPYGVSPLAIRLHGANVHKPKRKDIDRILKPFEVWTKAPRTVLLGTSRIHQAMDPTVLNGTPLAPAYNASIPASSLQLNVSHLRKYLSLAPELKTVMVELMMYNFIEVHPEAGKGVWADLAHDASALLLSGDACWASAQTLYYNAKVQKPAPEIRPGGDLEHPDRREYSPSNENYRNFLNYPSKTGIWVFHERHVGASGRMELQESSFRAVAEMVRLCRERGVRLLFLVTPVHAQDEYYIDAFGGAELKVRWLERLAAMGDIYVFPFRFEICYEEIGKGMRYWYDPMHFSKEIGDQMLRSLSGPERTLNDDQVVARLLAPGMARAYVESRQVALRQWTTKNPWFVTAFDTGGREWMQSRSRQP